MQLPGRELSPAPPNHPPDAAADPAGAAAAATRATYAVFIASGFAFASWASRIPAVRDHLGLDSSRLGLVLLSIAAGSVVSLPIAGWIIHRTSTRVTVNAMAGLLSLGLVLVGIGYLTGIALVVVGLFLLGFGNGAWDVGMNVQGAGVERRLGRPIMPRFHAGYSLGTVAGALVGAVMEALHVPVTAHLIGVAVVVTIAVTCAVRDFLHDADDLEPVAEHTATVEPPERTGVFVRWNEPRTLLIGVFVLAFAFAEGTGNDWISIGLIDGYHVPTVVGTLGFAVFLTAMTSGRWLGPHVLSRYGRVTVVRVLAAVALAGLAMFVFGRVVGVAYAGALLWGVGTPLGFPAGMSAAADEPSAAAGRVSVVASIGYCAFLGGPPAIGFLASHFGILHAFLALVALLAVAACLAGNLRAPGGSTPVGERLPREATRPGPR